MLSSDRKPTRPRLRRFLTRTLKWVGVLSFFIVFFLLFLLRDGIYHRFVLFPKQAAAWEQLRTLREPIAKDPHWNEYRGILHSHSHISHDSDVPFEEILRAITAANLDFIALSDHCVDGVANFDWQWRGIHGGKLFIPGFEMRNGLMPFGARPGTILSNSTETALLARQIVTNGGVLFYAHPEESREWDLPELTGMEIYNLHVDFKRQKGLLPDLLFSFNKYPEQVLHRICQRPTEFLQRWDDLNRTRKITGIAANDCHQNVGRRAFYLESGTIRVEDTGGKNRQDFKLNWLTRPFAKWLFGPLEPGRKLFEFQLDPYERSARFVNTHILAKELTEPAVLDALRAGRVFIGFDMIADSTGFRWYAGCPTGIAVTGEKMDLANDPVLRALSPLPCRFTIVHDGKPVHQAEGRSLEWKPSALGKYRVEAELNILNNWVQWVYTNPIELN